MEFLIPYLKAGAAGVIMTAVLAFIILNPFGLRHKQHKITNRFLSSIAVMILVICATLIMFVFQLDAMTLCIASGITIGCWVGNISAFAVATAHCKGRTPCLLQMTPQNTAKRKITAPKRINAAITNTYTRKSSWNIHSTPSVLRGPKDVRFVVVHSPLTHQHVWKGY